MEVVFYRCEKRRERGKGGKEERWALTPPHGEGAKATVGTAQL
jgi:hypothetical protein